MEAFFKNPFADVKEARTAPLVIRKALISPVPDTANGWLVAIRPLRASTTERVARGFAAGRSPGPCCASPMRVLAIARAAAHTMSCRMPASSSVADWGNGRASKGPI